jgi:quercetin dioxygenase-like cupin family protein
MRRFESIALTLLSAALGCASKSSAPPPAQPAPAPSAPAAPLEIVPLGYDVSKLPAEHRWLVRWGDRDTGPHGGIEMSECGDSALHIHKHNTYVVVIAGTMKHQFEDGPEAPDLGPGSFYTKPIDAAHTSHCKCPQPCLLAFWKSGKGPGGMAAVQPHSVPKHEPGIAWPAASIAFETVSAPVRSATLWKADGTAGVLERLPAGSTSAARSDPFDTHEVIIDGTVVFETNGEAPTAALGPGTYVRIPAGRSISARCTGTSECALWKVHDER